MTVAKLLGSIKVLYHHAVRNNLRTDQIANNKDFSLKLNSRYWMLTSFEPEWSIISYTWYSFCYNTYIVHDQIFNLFNL